MHLYLRKTPTRFGLYIRPSSERTSYYINRDKRRVTTTNAPIWWPDIQAEKRRNFLINKCAYLVYEQFFLYTEVLKYFVFITYLNVALFSLFIWAEFLSHAQIPPWCAQQLKVNKAFVWFMQCNVLNSVGSFHFCVLLCSNTK